MDKSSLQQAHPKILKRLKRAEGQIRSIIAMIEAERSCLDIAQQLLAVESAIREAKKVLVHDHIDHCLDKTATVNLKARAAIEDFKAITKYL